MNNTNETPPRAVVYLRVASAAPCDNQAVDQQRHGCQRIADQYGLNVVREYIDHGKPARILQQDALLDLMQDIMLKNDVAFVVVWDYTRLARDLKQLEQLEAFFTKSKVKIVTMRPHEAADRLLKSQIASLLDKDINGEGH